MEVSGLEPHVVYSVRVKALSPDGRFGNFSEPVYINRVDEGIQMFRQLPRYAVFLL